MAEDGNNADQSPYQRELKVELNKLNTEDFVHAARLLNEEVKRVEGGDKYKVVPLIELHHNKATSNAVKVTIPVKQFPNYNFVGKLLGPKGNTLKQLQQETLCKLSILGRGSMRDKNKEEELRKEGGKYAHLNEELHVMIECFAETVECYNRLSHAVTEIKKFMVPTLEDQPGRPAPMDDQGGFYNGEQRMGHLPGGEGMLPPGRGAPLGRGGLLSTPASMAGPGAPPTRGAMVSAGRGAVPQRGAPGARGGPLRGAPAGRGGLGAPRGGLGAPRGGLGAPRGTPAPRGAPPTGRGAPGLRGAPAQRGAPAAGRGVPPQRGMPAQRGMAAQRGLPAQRGAPVARGAPGAMRGVGQASRGAAQGRMLPARALPSQQLVQEYDDYGLDPVDGLGATEYEADPLYGQETRYDDGYGRRDLYADEQAYEEPLLGAGDTQYFDYGHGSTGVSDYRQEYDNPRSATGLDRGLMKPAAPLPGRSVRGTYRAHPYDTGRQIATSRPNMR